MTKATERTAIEAALKLLNVPTADYEQRVALGVLMSAARKHLDTLPVPRTVFKVTGVRPRTGRDTSVHSELRYALDVAYVWLKDGTEHVAIFRDEV